jgi:hypothetical protein
MRYAIVTALIIVTTMTALPAWSAESRMALQPGSLPRAELRTDGSEGVDLPYQGASSFGDALRYADMLGRQARRGGSIAFAGGLGSSQYGLLDPKTSRPRPSYWVAVLWRRLMDNVVLDPGVSRLDFHVYAQCLRGVPGGVALLVVNNNRDVSRTLRIAGATQRYTLAADAVHAREVKLNGRMLRLGPDKQLPMMAGAVERAGSIRLPPATITFLAVPYASNRQCRAR